LLINWKSDRLWLEIEIDNYSWGKGKIPIKKWMMLYVLLIGLLLVGCVDDEKDEVVDPPPQPTEVENEAETAITLKPDIQVNYGKSKSALWRFYDRHCWETADKKCSLKPTPAQEILKHARANQVKLGDEINFRHSVSPELKDFPQPDAYEVLIHNKDGSTTAVEVDNNKAKVPMVEGRYYMSVKVIWSGEVKGEAIYAFLLSVK
jgi:hypothetical protein